MLAGATLITATAVLAVVAVGGGQATPTASLSTRLSEVATRYCIDVLSRRVALPTAPEGEPPFLARYGLTAGIPNAAMTAIGRDVSLIAQAMLASGETHDGAFIVALGGRAGQTCRIVVYKAPLDGLFVQATNREMQTRPNGWRSLPVPPQPAAAIKLSLFKRDADNRPYLANVLAPYAPGAVAAVVTVAAIPAQVTLPKGY